MNQRNISIGFSPCPNDTFMFHALLAGRVDCGDLRFEPHLADIEELNQRALHGPHLAVTKLSLPAMAAVLGDYALLAAGAALGHGCGPLVVVRNDSPIRNLTDLHRRRVGIPGQLTTANLLLRLFCGREPEYVELRFDRIMAAVSSGSLEAGLVIHESRFTYDRLGLRQVADLGEIWEADTGLPLPLGLIAAQRQLGASVIGRIESAISASVAAAFAQPEASATFVQEHAQETDAELCRRHIALYVTPYSLDMGAVGQRSVDELLSRGRAAGLLPSGPSPWPTSSG